MDADAHSRWDCRASLVHLHLTFAGVVCLLSLMGRQEQRSLTTRLRVLKLATQSYSCATDVVQQAWKEAQQLSAVSSEQQRASYTTLDESRLRNPPMQQVLQNTLSNAN